ncbi:hypothetical protein [Wolbachia endosymbiont of Nomada ferruginata]|nr:hypothetical protein [Wolbachia endosymbiont of Nomada ferruginata]
MLQVSKVLGKWYFLYHLLKSNQSKVGQNKNYRKRDEKRPAAKLYVLISG